MTIGETIQSLRTKRRLSQEQLAELVGVSRQAVSKWELNAALPDTDKLVPLARPWGCPLTSCWAMSQKTG